MTTKGLAIATAVGVVAVVALLFAYPAMAASLVPPSSQNSISQGAQSQSVILPRLEVGQTFTLTSTAGGYVLVGDSSVNGTATGSVTVQVTGGFRGGYALSVTGGSLNVNGTNYVIVSGSAELGPRERVMVGQAQAGTAQLLFEGRDLGRFGSAAYGVLRIDLTTGSGEFGVKLLVAMSS